MDQLSINEMQLLSGGELVAFVDGFCAGVAAGGVLAWAIGASIPVAGQAIIGGCALWGLGRLFG